MSGLTRERGDTVIGPRTSQSVLSSLLYRLRVSQKGAENPESRTRSREGREEEGQSPVDRPTSA